MTSRSRLPLCSSDQLVAALVRLGCWEGRATASSHRLFHRDVDGRIETTSVILGRREVPRGTLRSILRSLRIGADEFVAALR